MSYLMNNQQKMNEIIFADRNKNYGAYVIRSAYGETVFKALLITTAFVATLFTIAWVFTERVEDVLVHETQIFDSVYSVKVDLKKEEPAETGAKKSSTPETSRPDNKAALTSTVIADSSEVTESTTTTLIAVQTSSAETDGDVLAKGSGTNTGNDSGLPEGIPESTIKSNYQVDKMPEFEGGLPALYRFISTNIRYTDDAREAAQGGKIYVRFVVHEDGTVGSVTLLNKLGYGLDEEALRVMGIVPAFKSPAMSNGKPVKMYYELPINFKLR